MRYNIRCSRVFTQTILILKSSSFGQVFQLSLGLRCEERVCRNMACESVSPSPDLGKCFSNFDLIECICEA